MPYSGVTIACSAISDGCRSGGACSLFSIVYHLSNLVLCILPRCTSATGRNQVVHGAAAITAIRNGKWLFWDLCRLRLLLLPSCLQPLQLLMDFSSRDASRNIEPVHVEQEAGPKKHP